MNRVDILAARAAVARLGLMICVAIPLLLIVFVLFAYSPSGFLSRPQVVTADMKVFGYTLLAIAILDPLIGFFMKKKLLAPQTLKSRYTFQINVFAQQLPMVYVPVFAICAAPAIYGIIYYIVGGELDMLVLMSIISPAAFLLLRPKDEEIERLASEIFGLTSEQSQP